MTNPTVTSFYEKASYEESYDSQHGARLDELVAHYNLKETLKGKRALDVGGGMGFLGRRLDPTTDYWVIDGADIRPEQRLCKGEWFRADLDHDQFGSYCDTTLCDEFDVGFLLETIEHCGNPHHVLAEMKKLVKLGGLIYISIPTEEVWHNTPYPGLLWPPQNFLQFLGQMSLPLFNPARENAYIYKPNDRGWPAYQFRCVNESWEKKRLLYPKEEAKFLPLTPLEATNV